MAIRNAQDIDRNFAIEKKLSREGMIFKSAEELDVYGVELIDGVYRRMKYDDAKAIGEMVALISSECAGGRVRVATDSPYVAIYVEYKSCAKVPNYSLTATMGFDLYAGERYIGCYVPALDTAEEFESIIRFDDTPGMREYTLNFPVCSEISGLYIGVDEKSAITGASAYAIEKPVVFYGSSTTQGACASRPGNSYENMISRRLNCNYLNLAFWGNALGEEKMAEYIAGLEMSAFVYDYDYNSPSAEHLEATHERMFKIIRERNPDLPIIILTAPKYYHDEEFKQRHDIIERTYLNAIKSGDKAVRFISCRDIFEDVRDVALADNIHPGDIGFSKIAEHVSLALKELMKI